MNPTDPPSGVASWCERIEARAWSDAVLALSERSGNVLRANAAEVNTVKLTSVASLDFGPFNRGLGLGIEQPADEQAVSDIVAFYDRAGVSHYTISVSPLAQPPEIAGWLAAQGMAPTAKSAKLWRLPAATDPVQSSFRTELIDASAAPAWAGVQRAAWGMPKGMTPWFTATVGRSGWRHYLGFDEETPVTAAALFVSERVGWLGFGATVPSHRGRGGQTGTLARRVKDAQELGCSLLVTETGDPSETPNPSYDNIVRAGFELGYLRTEYSPGGG